MMILELKVNDLLDRDRDDVVDWAWRLSREERAQALDGLLEVIRREDQVNRRRMHAAAAIQAMAPRGSAMPEDWWAVEETRKTLQVLLDVVSSTAGWDVRKACALATLAVCTKGTVPEAVLQRGLEVLGALRGGGNTADASFSQEALQHLKTIAGRARSVAAAGSPSPGRGAPGTIDITLLADRCGLSVADATRLLQGTFDSIADVLVVKGRIELLNFGVLEVRVAKPRAVKSTKGKVLMKSGKRIVVFTPSRQLEKRLP